MRTCSETSSVFIIRPVGRDRARYLSIRLPIPPVVTVRAPFTAYGGPMGGLLAFLRSINISPDSWTFVPYGARLVSWLLCLPLTVWPFAMCTVFPRSDYYGHADSLLRHWRFSELFPVHDFRSPSHHQEGLPCSLSWTQMRSRRWWFSINPYLHTAGFSVGRG